MAQGGSDAALIAGYTAGAIDSYIGGATFTIILYEYFITFGAEVLLFWRKKISLSPILFFLNRYLVLFYQLLQLRRQWVFRDPIICALYYNSSQAIIVLCYIPWGAFSALRVFALARRRKVLAATTVFILSMGPVATNLASFHWSTVKTEPSQGTCTGVIQLPEILAFRLTIVSRLTLIAADLMVIVLTWAPTYEVAKIARAEFGKKRTTLAFVVLRDGLIFFTIMLTLNVLHITLTWCSVLLGADHTSEITEITETLTAILVSRLMLNLQEVSYRQGATKSEYESALAAGRTISSLHFDRIVGSFGRSLCPSPSPSPDGCEGELGDPNEEEELGVLEHELGRTLCRIQSQASYHNR